MNIITEKLCVSKLSALHKQITVFIFAARQPTCSVNGTQPESPAEKTTINTSCDVYGDRLHSTPLRLLSRFDVRAAIHRTGRGGHADGSLLTPYSLPLHLTAGPGPGSSHGVMFARKGNVEIGIVSVGEWGVLVFDEGVQFCRRRRRDLANNRAVSGQENDTVGWLW